MSKQDSLLYKSTRGKSKELFFKDVVFEGLASDGGLYIPKEWPKLDSDLINDFKKMSYQEIAFFVFREYIDSSLSDSDLKDLIDESYSSFTNKEITPISKISDSEYLLELFHGPTYAFKDIAMQFISKLMDIYLKKDGSQINILGGPPVDWWSRYAQPNCN